MEKEIRKAVPAVYIFFVRGEGDNEELLLGERRNTGFMDGMLMCPGGHVTLGESPSFATVREAEEEVGVHVQANDLRFIQLMSRPANNLDGDRIDIFFECRKWGGEIVNKEPHKCKEWQWVSRRRLPDNIVPYIQFVIDRWNNTSSNVYSEYGW